MAGDKPKGTARLGGLTFQFTIQCDLGPRLLRLLVHRHGDPHESLDSDVNA